MAILITDPIDILLDQNGDLDLSSGGAQFSRGPVAVRQGCRIACLMVQGEWFLNLDQGVTWLQNATVSASQAILGQKFDQLKALIQFRRALNNVPGVANIASLTVTFDNKTRRMKVAWIVRTTFGDTVADSLDREA